MSSHQRSTKPVVFKSAASITRESRRNLQETCLQLRKQRKDTMLQRRRMEYTIHSNNTSNDAVAQDSMVHTTLQQQISILVQCQQQQHDEHNGLLSAHSLFALTSIRRLVSTDSLEPIQYVVQSGVVVPILVALVSMNMTTDLSCVEVPAKDPTAWQCEAVWILTNIASCNETALVANSGVVPALLHHMHTSDKVVLREQCTWCIGNIAAHSIEYRDALWRERVLIAGM
jgi:hypothetical protein